MPASLSCRSLWTAVAIVCASSTFAAESNDHDVLGAWKGTGDDVQWVLNFLPNDTYQLRLGDSPTGSRGEYVTRGGKFQLLEGNQKRDVMSGSYRLEDCNVLILTLPNGTARMNRRGTIPTGGCGKGKTAVAATSGGVFGSVGKSTSGSGSSTSSPPVAGTTLKPSGNLAVPDTAKTAVNAKSGVQKTAQPSTAAAKTTAQQSAKAATAEGASAIKTGAAAFWDKAKGVSHIAVEAGGKAAKAVGTKAQQAGKAVSKTFKGTPEEAADEAAAKAGKQGD